MSFVRTSTSVAAILAALGLFGCATTSGNLTHSAERLERSADALRDDARHDTVSSSFARDAQELADEARDFRRVVDDRHASDRDVQEAFEDLSKRYHALRDQVERTHDRDAERDFQPVTDAYLDVEREMRGYKRDDRYARD
jgi:hypothetical protein